MAFVVKDMAVWCTTCKTWAKTFEYHLYVCPKCKNKDFIS